MHIAVLAKRVPDSAAKIRPDAAGTGVDAQGVEFVISSYDEIAIESAIQLKEAGAASRVTIVCLGPSVATKEIRKALAMGADDAVLLTEDRAFRDPRSTAAVLADAVRELGADVVFCGWKAIDDDSSVVGGLVAERLGYAYASFVTSIEAADGGLRVHREVEGTTQVVRLPTPCVVTAQKGLAEPRFASLKGIMKAKRKTLEQKAPSDNDNGSRLVSLASPPERPAGRIVGEGVAAVPELVRVLKDDVGVL